MFKTVQTNLKPTQQNHSQVKKKKTKKIYVAVRLELEHRTSLDLKTSAFPLDQCVLAVNKDNFL